MCLKRELNLKKKREWKKEVKNCLKCRHLVVFIHIISASFKAKRESYKWAIRTAKLEEEKTLNKTKYILEHIQVHVYGTF